MLRRSKNSSYPLQGKGCGDLKIFRRKPLWPKAFGHLMIFLTIAIAEQSVESIFFEFSVFL
jgi:hypothetical protein